MMIETSQETMLRPMMDNENNVTEEQRFALHTIDNPTKISFDRHAYSRYKYGDSRQAKQFGEELAAGFLNQYQDFLLTAKQQFVAISSPRGTVPPAAYYIFQAFLEKLNRFLQFHARDPVLEHTIQRLGTLAEDYSLLSRHERFERLIDERYFIDSQPLRNKLLIFVDDIRITGNSHFSRRILDLPRIAEDPNLCLRCSRHARNEYYSFARRIAYLQSAIIYLLCSNCQ